MKIGRLLKEQTPKRRKLQLGLFVALALALILVAAGHTINSPATGTITRSGGSAAQSSNSVLVFTESSKQYDGKYINFTYPSDYQAGYSSLNGNYLEIHRIYGPSHSDRSIIVGVVRESIANDSGVLYRQNHPEIYKSQPAPAGSLIFLSGQSGFERTVFITHADLVASISAVDPGGHDITDALNAVVNSLAWK